jgi:hypothetical protein
MVMATVFFLAFPSSPLPVSFLVQMEVNRNNGVTEGLDISAKGIAFDAGGGRTFTTA